MEYALEGPSTGRSIIGKLGLTQSAHDAATWATTVLEHAGITNHAALSALGLTRATSMFAG